MKINTLTPVTISAYDYTVNDIGQRKVVDTSGSAFKRIEDEEEITDERDRAWDYDDLGQLTSENDAGDDTLDRGFLYDAIGNRLASIKGDTDPTATGATGYTPNALNQYSAIDPGDSVIPHYDVDGNLLDDAGINNGSSGDRNYVWDAENRLVEVRDESENTTLATYAYDHLGRRIRRTVVSGDAIAYLYDGWNVIAEYDVSSTPALIVKNLWGLDLSGSMQGAGGVGGLLSVTNSTGTYSPTYDGNGNVTEYLGTGAAIAAHFEYDAFGNTVKFTELSSGLAAAFRYRLSTKPLDPTSEWYYYGYRWYDPLTGRWPSRDPIGERGGVNLYGFLGNDGVNGNDNLGLIKFPDDVSPPPIIPGSKGESPDNFNFYVGISIAVFWKCSVTMKECCGGYTSWKTIDESRSGQVLFLDGYTLKKLRSIEIEEIPKVISATSTSESPSVAEVTEYKYIGIGDVLRFLLWTEEGLALANVANINVRSRVTTELSKKTLSEIRSAPTRGCTSMPGKVTCEGNAKFVGTLEDFSTEIIPGWSIPDRDLIPDPDWTSEDKITF